MLELMRKHAKSWIMKLLLFMIIIVFALYFGSMGGEKTAEAVATVDGKAISYMDFQREYQNLLETARQQFQGQLTNEMIKTLNLRQQALDNLINRALILRKADAMGIKVTDEELRLSILAFPGFQRDGVFREYLYHDLLRMNRLTPEEFETVHRKNILVEKVRELLQHGVFVTDQEVLDLYRMRNEKVSIRFAKIEAADLVKGIKPSTEDLEKFLKENGEKFRVPEQIRLKYLFFSRDTAAAGVALTEDDVEGYLESHREDWLRSDAKLTESALRNRATAELKRIKGMQHAARLAKDAHDTIYQEENFDRFAEQNGYPVHKTGFFPISRPPSEFAAISDFTSRIIDLHKDDISRVMSDENGYYLFQLLEKKASHIPPLKDVEVTVRDLYFAERSRELAAETALRMIDRLKKGEDWQKVLAEKQLVSYETGYFLPGEDIPRLGPSEEISDSLLQLTSHSPYPDKAFRVGDGTFVVIRFIARGDIDPADYETRKAALKQGLLRFKREDVVRAWLEANKASLVKAGKLKIRKDVQDL